MEKTIHSSKGYSFSDHFSDLLGIHMDRMSVGADGVSVKQTGPV